MEKKSKILILEDDEITQQVYMGIFSKSTEFELVLCKNDVELYEALDKNHIDLFLVDIGLSRSKDGLQIIKELRQMDKYKSSPIIVVSAYTLLKDEHDSILAGATKFIRKPFDLQELRNEFAKINSNLV